VRRSTLVPQWRTLVLSAALVSVYAVRLGFLPPRWEEPRRCIIAIEMVTNDDYVVPTFYGEIYAKKPPLQNWLLALLSGFDARRIDIHLVRALSVAAVLATALMLAVLARGTRWPFLAPAIFLTLGIMVQYGRSGETDPLFTFCTTGAFFFYELGRRSRNAWLRWVPSQLLVALGALTKAISPLFFYPAVLLHLWLEARMAKEPRRGAGERLPALVGLTLAALAVALWLVPYARQASLAGLGGTGAEEILARTPMTSTLADFGVALVAFPTAVLGGLLPWSLLTLSLVRREVRRVVATAWRGDPYLRLASVICVIGFAALWLMPGARSRYLMPVFPFFAAALAALIEAASALSSPRIPIVARLTLAAGLVYAASFIAFYEPTLAGRTRPSVGGAKTLAAALVEDARRQDWDPATIPIACASELNNRVCFVIMTELARTLSRPPVPESGGYTITRAGKGEPPGGAALLARHAGLELWLTPPALRTRAPRQTTGGDAAR
jgi:4-amino-4-deoxy-L-arabinose transferase-like glycosyltransferase